MPDGSLGALFCRALAQDARADHEDLHRVLSDLLAYEHWWRATDPAQDADWKESDHPRSDDGKFGSGGGGSSKTASQSFGKKGDKPPASLNGVAFASWKPPSDAMGWENAAEEGPGFAEPAPPKPPTYTDDKGKTHEKKLGAGVIIREPDGRVWIMHPTNAYGGYKATFPKGGIDKGYSPRATALKEAFEETGLRVELTGFAGDIERDTSMARYYFAKRIGGTPADHGKEAERITLAPVGDLKTHLNRSVDRKMVDTLLGDAGTKPAAAPKPGATLDLASMKQIGGKLGSNPGGRYQDASGKQYYVKQSKSLDHAKNELLAARLYEAVGSPVLAAMPVKMGNKLGTATEWQKSTPIDRHDPAQRKEAQAHFATHAWLANWDAAGLEYDNQGRVGGKMTTLDPGGSLLFRAQGGPKGSAFGNSVGEWDSLRSPSNAQAHRIFGEMTPAQLKASAAQVTKVPDATIRALVEEHGPGTAEQRKALADKLIARKADIAKRAGAVAQDAEFKESDHPRSDDGKFGSGGGGAAPGKGKASLGNAGTMKPLAKGTTPPAHIAALKVPPGWSDVHYNPDPKGSLLVTGRDAKGRRTAIYSGEFSAANAAAKFARVNELMQKFDAIAKQNDAAKKDPAKRDVAEALELVMKMGIRPGSERDTGADKQAYGATTLEGRHVRVTSTGKVSLQFTGKKGVDLNLPVEDAGLAKMLARRKLKAGAKGKLFGVTDAALREHSHDMDGGGFKTKDFRTHLGTKTAMGEVAQRDAPASPTAYKRAVREVAKVVASKLGNTAAVALQAYIAPEVFSEWRAAAGA
jgi:DNA topoisomerase IB/8-oxo-dGTP pyrophosphatase MutT (NUDIX family)